MVSALLGSLASALTKTLLGIVQNLLARSDFRNAVQNEMLLQASQKAGEAMDFHRRALADGGRVRLRTKKGAGRIELPGSDS